MFTAALGPQFQPKIDYFPASAAEWFAKGVYNLVDNWVSNNRWALAIEDSGLVLLSRYPIVAVHHHTFRSRRGFDAWVRKGVLHAVVQLDTTSPESSLDVFVTHLQAQRYHHARRGQIKELTRFIRKHRRVSATRPALVMGDFNIDGNAAKHNHASAQYGVLNSALRRVIPNVVDVWCARHATTPGFTNPKRNKRIDYIFATAHKGFVTEHVDIQEFFAVPNDTSLDSVEPASSHAATTLSHTLSDHAGVAATLVWIQSE
jgi:endonuclease/exonuclease/phosphatase family metal-dependent hydrolase